MDFTLQGKASARSQRPSSGRPRSARNPITGEEICYGSREATPRAGDPAQQGTTRPDTRPFSRPDEVPALNLGRLKDDNYFREPGPFEYAYNIQTPNTASTVSWGTPASTERQQYYQHQPSHRQPPKTKPATPKQPTAWDQQPVPEDLPPPSQRYRDTYRQYQEDVKQSYRQHTSQQHSEEEVRKKVEELKLKFPTGEEDEELDEQGIGQDSVDRWVSQHAELRQQPDPKKMDKEELEAEKMKGKLVETVMIDQLSRSVLSDPEQSVRSYRHIAHIPGMQRGAIRTLHESKVQTSGSATENLLSRRVRFGARVLTRCGNDAIRELTGFFFAVDNTLTIYEFRQFGKSAKALPFITRGTYHRLNGRRKGKPYTLVDIVPGSNLVFGTEDQHSLPDSMAQHSHATFRITEVDNEAKENILMPNVKSSNRDDIWARLHMPPTKEERDDINLLNSIQATIRSRLKKRGIRTVTGLGNLFRKIDDTGDGLINKVELERAMIDYRIEIPGEDFNAFWELLDTDGSGSLDYGEFIRGIIGEMSEQRKYLVRKAFRKIDANKKGTVSFGDIKKFYNAHNHPSVLNGEATEAEVLALFLETFCHRLQTEEVTYTQFDEYYEGLSIGIEDNDTFASILKSSWNI